MPSERISHHGLAVHKSPRPHQGRYRGDPHREAYPPLRESAIKKSRKCAKSRTNTLKFKHLITHFFRGVVLNIYQFNVRLILTLHEGSQKGFQIDLLVDEIEFFSYIVPVKYDGTLRYVKQPGDLLCRFVVLYQAGHLNLLGSKVEVP